jgi:hypothetical protein
MCRGMDRPIYPIREGGVATRHPAFDGPVATCVLRVRRFIAEALDASQPQYIRVT